MSEKRYRRDFPCRSIMDSVTSLDIDVKPASTRLTGIVCTFGPSSNVVDVLVEMFQYGMNILRLKLHHGRYDNHTDTINDAKKIIASIAEEEENSTAGVLAIALETKGPEIRTGMLKEGEVLTLKQGDLINLTADPSYATECTNEVLYVDYRDLTSLVTPNNEISIDYDLIRLQVNSVDRDEGFVECEVIVGGLLRSKKAVHFPGLKVDLPAISEIDTRDIMFAVENQVDMIFASYIQNAASVNDIRRVLGEEGKHILVISKIENREGVKNIDEIIMASDGIMIGGGCQGIHLPREKVFLAQKMIIAKCNIAGKPVIAATQMMDSMIRKPRPTRAESCGIANAVLDGADCILLCCETAEGDFPLAAVEVVHAICLEAEAAFSNRAFFNELIMKTKVPVNIQASTALAAVEVALNCKANAIIVLTRNGKTPKCIAKYRPPCPILAVTRDSRLARQIIIYRAVVPLVYEGEEQADHFEDVDRSVQFAVAYGRGRNIIKSGEKVVVVSKSSKDYEKDTDTVRILDID